MFDDIIKKEFNIDVIRRDLTRFIEMFYWEQEDTITERHIVSGILSYFEAYGCKPVVSLDYTLKKISVMFDNKILIFSWYK